MSAHTKLEIHDDQPKFEKESALCFCFWIERWLRYRNYGTFHGQGIIETMGHELHMFIAGEFASGDDAIAHLLDIHQNL